MARIWVVPTGRKTRILGCNIKIPSFQTSLGAEEGFNPQPYPQTFPKIHFFPLYFLVQSCSRSSPKASENGIFRFFPGVQYSRPRCPAAAAGTCSRSVFSRRSCLGFMAQTPPSCFTRNAEPRITAWEAQKILGIHLLPSQGTFHKGISDFQPRFQTCSCFPDFSPSGVRSNFKEKGIWNFLVPNREGWDLPLIPSSRRKSRKINQECNSLPCCSLIPISQQIEGKEGEKGWMDLPRLRFSLWSEDGSRICGVKGKGLENHWVGDVHPQGKLLEPFPSGIRDLGSFLEAQGREWGQTMEPKAKPAAP